MSDEVRHRGIRAGDLARVVSSALAAAILGGTVLGFTLELELSSPGAWVVGALVLAAALAALSYRHVGAMAAAGAVLAGLGFSQIFTMQLALIHFEPLATRIGRYALQPSTLLVLLGCVLVGAGLGWSILRARAEGKWSHYGVWRMVGALPLGVLVGMYFVRGTEGIVLVDEVMPPLTVLLLCAVVGLLLGMLPALSPTGLLPALGIVLLMIATGGSRWDATLLMVGIVLLSVAAHFVGPVQRSTAFDTNADADGARGGDSGIPRDRAAHEPDPAQG